MAAPRTTSSRAASSPAPAVPTPLELSAAALAQQTAMLEDARGGLSRALSAAIEADGRLSSAKSALESALAASAAKREDDGLADVAARARVRLGHAQDDDRRAKQELAAAEVRVREVSAFLEKVERAHEVQKIAALRSSNTVRERRRAAASAAIAAAKAVVAALLDLRTQLREEEVLVIRANELGAGLRPLDGTAYAGELIAALADAGGAFHDTPAKSHSLRWAIERTEVQRPDPLGFFFAGDVVSLVLEAMTVGAREDAANYRPGLQQIGAVWPKYSNRLDAKAELEALDAAEVRARDAKNAAAHEQRLLGTARAAEIARRRGAGLPKPVPGPMSPGPHNPDDPTRNKEHPYWKTPAGKAVQAKAEERGVSPASLMYGEDTNDDHDNDPRVG